jgi:hypothetical protein
MIRCNFESTVPSLAKDGSTSSRDIYTKFHAHSFLYTEIKMEGLRSHAERNFEC